jgi:hypothetical protein
MSSGELESSYYTRSGPKKQKKARLCTVANVPFSLPFNTVRNRTVVAPFSIAVIIRMSQFLVMYGGRRAQTNEPANIHELSRSRSIS